MCLAAAVPRYFFHLHNDTYTRDEEGCVLPDLEAARASAIRDARSLMASQVIDGRLCHDDRVEIADGDGKNLADVSFYDAVEIQRKSPRN